MNWAQIICYAMISASITWDDRVYYVKNTLNYTAVAICSFVFWYGHIGIFDMGIYNIINTKEILLTLFLHGKLCTYWCLWSIMKSPVLSLRFYIWNNPKIRQFSVTSVMCEANVKNCKAWFSYIADVGDAIIQDKRKKRWQKILLISDLRQWYPRRSTIYESQA